MLVDIEVERHQRMIGEHHTLRLLKKRTPPRRVDLCRGLRQQRIVFGVLVVRQIDAEVAL